MDLETRHFDANRTKHIINCQITNTRTTHQRHQMHLKCFIYLMKMKKLLVNDSFLHSFIRALVSSAGYKIKWLFCSCFDRWAGRIKSAFQNWKFTMMKNVKSDIGSFSIIFTFHHCYCYYMWNESLKVDWFTCSNIMCMLYVHVHSS